jgi:hypothetical protein
MPILQLCDLGINPNLTCTGAMNRLAASKGVLMSTITVTGVPKVSTPRGALWAACAATALWQALSRKPQAPLSVAEEAAREAMLVRALAHHHMKTDPGFAADLLAAADRHERLAGD